MRVFQNLLQEEKARYERSSSSVVSAAGLNMIVPHRVTRVQIRRDHNIILEAYRGLQQSPASALKGKLQIEFVNELGMTEAGIDGGGILKEFMDCMARQLTSTTQAEDGLFQSTERHELIPSYAHLLQKLTGGRRGRGELGGLDRRDLYRFIGKIVAKAVLENILFAAEFSTIFLNLLLGRSNRLDDLYYYDRYV